MPGVLSASPGRHRAAPAGTGLSPIPQTDAYDTKSGLFAHVPRNATGKIEKPKLREIYCGESVVAQQNEIEVQP